MVSVAIAKLDGSSTGALDLNEAVFGAAFNEDLIHQTVVAYMAGGRAGTKGQKTRAEVRGGGRKPWKQKGNGRARAGSIRSPIWRGGGKSFAAVTRDFSQKVNRSMYRGAMRSIFSELLRQGRLTVLESFDVAEAKTKAFLAQAESLGLVKGLVVVEEVSEALFLASRNVPNVAVILSREVNPAALVWAEKVIITRDALKSVEEWLE